MFNLLLLTFSAILWAFGNAQNVGYVGPGCAVTDDSLYIHGMFVRKLGSDELQEFYKYQGAKEVFKELNHALSVGSASIAPNSSLLFTPEMPRFCNGIDDSTEIVLNGCIVRQNNVHMAGRLIRSLTPVEKEKIDAIIQKSQQNPRKGRKLQIRLKRSVPENPQNDAESRIVGVLSHLLNLNASVAERFVPMAKRAPIVERLNEGFLRALRNEILERQQNRRRKIEEPLDFEDQPQESFPVEVDEDQLDSEVAQENSRKRRQVEHAFEDSDGVPHLILPAHEVAQPQQQQMVVQPPQQQQPHYGGINFNTDDAIIRQLLLHSTASNQWLAQQQLTPPGLPTSEGQTAPAAAGVEAIQPGQSIVLGGQTYVAIPLSNVLPPSSALGNHFGLMPSGNGQSQQIQQQFWPNDHSYFATPEKVAVEEAMKLPNEICQIPA